MVAMKGRRPGLDVAELLKKASFAESELNRACQVPVPQFNDAEELLGQPASSSSGHPEDLIPEQVVQGQWKSEKGICRVFSDHITCRLAYEEWLGESDGRLHGWLERQDGYSADDAIACWQATLHYVEEGEPPWYGPSFGEEPEALGQIRLRLFPEKRIDTAIMIEEEDEDWQEPTSFNRRTTEELEAEAEASAVAEAAAEKAAESGAFVFGA
eukprot:TRINITY_DN114655_c0_g1_i1.p1 TRINITY_DN114655_c0_g1~~TRINITY_DN114655_c0_g1_i1.p1  ORF type:complete len:213 (+),score=44.35 TRINITY_DN114655_c0_g1_i1:131-769(+)